MTATAASDRPPLLRAVGLAKIFGPAEASALALLDAGRDKHEILTRTGCSLAVRGVDFEVRPGELFVIMGLSGCGKSTVIRLLNGLITPTRGSVALGTQFIHGLSAAALREIRNRRLSMVFQHCAIFPHKTVRENAAYGLQLRQMDAGERLRRADDALSQVGLRGWEDAYPADLSGGMKQRVGIARALAVDAEVMLMDEPFSALDPLLRRDMQDLLITLHRDSGRTIVFVTHDLNEAMRIGQRIMIMRDGAIAQLGTGAEILTAPANDYVSKFIADVDRTRVLTAADLMRPVDAGVDIVGEELRALPGTSLSELCDLARRTLQPVAVVDAHGKLLGTVDRDALLAAIGNHVRGP